MPKGLSEVLTYFLFNAGKLSMKSMIKSVFAKWWVEAGVGLNQQRSKTNSFFEKPVRDN